MTISANIYIEEVESVDGTQISFLPEEIIVIVGPNNSGKSTFLNELADQLYQTSTNKVLIDSFDLNYDGSVDEASARITSSAAKLGNQYTIWNRRGGFNPTFSLADITSFWEAKGPTLGAYYSIFVQNLSTSQRLAAVQPTGQIENIQSIVKNPMQAISASADLEEKISELFRGAFGYDLMATHFGTSISLHMGNRPNFDAANLQSYNKYEKSLVDLPAIHNQGDGIRSFVAILLHVFGSTNSILFIDEPEAFLHPPQAYRLGQIIAREKGKFRQLFLATHSGDFLRGLLSTDSKNLRVLRLDRQSSSMPSISQISRDEVHSVWSDPLLRYSNVLEGIFHNSIVLCEADSDCRFFHAIMDAIDTNSNHPARDILFTHCGGKARMHVVIKALRALKVPIRAVLDIDVLNDELIISRIVSAQEGNWTSIRPNWHIIHQWAQTITRRPMVSALKAAVESIFSDQTERPLTKEEVSAVQRSLSKISAWSEIKRVGKSFLPAGAVVNAFDSLLRDLENINIYVNPHGELEGLVRSIGNLHGPAFVNEVIAKPDLATNPELTDARAFTVSITS